MEGKGHRHWTGGRERGERKEEQREREGGGGEGVQSRAKVGDGRE